MKTPSLQWSRSFQKGLPQKFPVVNVSEVTLTTRNHTWSKMMDFIIEEGSERDQKELSLLVWTTNNREDSYIIGTSYPNTKKTTSRISDLTTDQVPSTSHL